VRDFSKKEYVMDFIGNKFTTNEGFEIEIIDYSDRHNVLVKFTNNPDYQVYATMQNIKNGQIKYPYLKTVYGIGYYGHGAYSSRINNCKTEQYIKWFSMFNRCYDKSYQEKQPTYIGCSVSEEFHNFQNFAMWYDKNIYACSYPLELDKDLFVLGNKVYSPSTCCFIPKEINNVLSYKRNDSKYMTSIYNKYKKELPHQIKVKLLSIIKEANI